MTLQEITRGDIQRESLHVADDCNHTQWIPESVLSVENVAEPGVLYVAPCGFCRTEGHPQRQWRRVYVQV